MRYMVMETHQSYCVLLDNEGRFLKAANMGYQVGQRIGEAVLFREAKPRGLSSRALVACAAAACLLLASGGLWRMETAVWGSVYLSINPQVRMDVNRSDKVMALTGLNADGAALAADIGYRRKDMDAVAEALVDRAIDMGYLHPGGQIAIELSGETDWEQAAGQRMEDRLEAHLVDKMEAEVVFGAPPPEEEAAPTAPPRVVIEVSAPPSPAPAPTPAPQSAAAQAAPGPIPHYGESGYGTSLHEGSSGYDSNSGYGGNSGYDSNSGYDGNSGYSGYGGASGYAGAS